MLVFCIKQLLSLKRAILGRREPHQLAWGLALGVWLGVVPYGNLVALAILLFILSVRVNHGMVAVTAVATSVIAAWFDAQTHAVGKYVLTHPQLTPQLSAAWQWPLVPWTDLNNTVVMGGVVVGLAAVVPAYLATYPLFRYLAPAAPVELAEDVDLPLERCADWDGDESAATSAPAPSAASLPVAAEIAGSAEAAISQMIPPFEAPETLVVDTAWQDLGRDEPEAELVDTRIEVVRLVEASAVVESVSDKPVALLEAPASLPAASESSLPEETAAAATPPVDPPMGEALNYLLRQLRDSRQRRAA